MIEIKYLLCEAFRTKKSASKMLRVGLKTLSSFAVKLLSLENVQEKKTINYRTFSIEIKPRIILRFTNAFRNI